MSPRTRRSAEPRGWKRSTLFARCGYASALGFALIATPAFADDDEQPQRGEIARNEPADGDSDLTLSVGGSTWHGKFGGATTTDISSVLVGARYRIGGLRLTATLPYMRIRSDGTFFAGLGGTPLFVAPQVRSLPRRRDGLGDLTLGASYLLPSSGGRGFDIELIGRVKVPTASDSSQLSTGKVDYSGGVEVSKSIGRLTPAVSATYRVFGDAAGWNFRNGLDVTAGATYAVSPRTALLVNYEYVRAASAFIKDSHEAVIGISTPIGGDRLRLNGYAAKGLSDGAADVSGGLSLSLKL